MQRYRQALFGLVLVLGFTAAIAGVVGPSGAEWPGEPSGCIASGECYCEAARASGLAQPANAASNVAFVLVGLMVLVAVGRGGGARTRPSRMGSSTLYPALFGYVAVFLGVGSAAFHGSLTEWGGWLDLVSMFAFIGFVIAYDLAVLRDWTVRRFTVVYGVSLAALALAQWPLDNSLGKFILGALILAALGLEWALAKAALVHRDRRWLFAALGTYGVAQVVWLSSRTDGPWCRPESFLQGHALWHFLTAATVGLIYVYLRTERAISREPSIEEAKSPPS